MNYKIFLVLNVQISDTLVKTASLVVVSNVQKSDQNYVYCVG